MENSIPPFPFAEETNKFNSALRKFLARLLAKKRGPVISEENVLGFRHGREWFTPKNDAEKPGTFSEHGAEMTLSKADIYENKVQSVLTAIEDIGAAMHAELMKTLYSTINEVTERTGNVVKAANKTHAQAFLEMLQRIEFGVDRQGNPSFPQLHVSPGMAETLIRELESQGPEFEAEVRRIQQEKIQKALETELARKSRFKKPS